MLERQAPSELLRQGQSGASAAVLGLPGMPSGKGYLLLQSASGAQLQAALASEIGLELPPPQEARIVGDYALLWLTPAEWLLELSQTEAKPVAVALTRRLATSLAVVTDMSDAFARCEVRGARAVYVLTSGCSLDLSLKAFPPGRVARTLLADIPAILWRPTATDRFRCLVDRSFAGHFAAWLVEVVRE